MEAMKGRWNLTNVVTGVNPGNSGGSGGSGGEVPVPPTPVSGAKSFYLWGRMPAQWDDNYPGFNGVAIYARPQDAVATCAAARARGWRIMLTTYLRSSVHVNHGIDDRFSFSKFMAQLTLWQPYAAALKEFHDDGTLIGFMVIDEPYCGDCWGGQQIGNATVDEMCRQHRLIFPWTRTYIRAAATRMTGFKWLWATGCMCQWEGSYAGGPTEGKATIEEYVGYQLAAAKSLGLTIMWGMIEVAWREYVPGTKTCASGVNSFIATRCYASAPTILHDGLYMARQEYSDGMYVWAISNPPSDWLKRSDVGAANVAIATELAS
jgi:hypothetical protein